LKSRGYRKFLINTVSSTLVCNKEDREDLKIGIENPRGKGIVAVVYAEDGETVSTSADNQRFFIENGIRYHHILDPETGYPARDFISVTVVAKKPAYWTDAVSTAVFVMSEEEAVLFAKKTGIKLFAITHKGGMIIFPQGSWIKILSD
jgi:thiamine biosynthesis lipoprotein